MQGKGDKRRPSGISLERFDSNWDKIFGQREKTENFKARYYTCKNCKKSIEITPEDEYICKACNTPIMTVKQPHHYLGFNPMARQTKMEFTNQSHAETVSQFREQKYGKK